MSEHRIVPCEHCGTEGRIYSGYSNDPHPKDEGPCPACEGTGGEIVEVEPITLDDLSRCTDCGAHLPMLYPCLERACPQRAPLSPDKHGGSDA
jgi:hypothetical protein